MFRNACYQCDCITMFMTMSQPIYRNLALNARTCIASQLQVSHSFRTLVHKKSAVVFRNSQTCPCRHPWNIFTRRNFKTRKSLSPVSEIASTSRGAESLIRPFAFTVLVSGCSFTGAAIWQYESMRELLHIRSDSERHSGHYGKAGSIRQHMNSFWDRMSPGKKVVASIIAINCGVFGLWLVPAFRGFMLKWFTSTPMSGAPCWSMLLSSFSHYSFLHLVLNMYVLWSFAPAVTQLLGKEQFTAMYLTAGVVSSFASYVVRVARSSRVPSLGASGAIMAVLGAVCYYYPDTQLNIAFVGDIIPHSFSASSALYAIITFDSLGVLLRWRFFDHAAHLGGVLFGIWYIAYGHRLIWKNRETLMRRWHDYRGKP